MNPVLALSAENILVAPRAPAHVLLLSAIEKVKNYFAAFQENPAKETRSNYFSSLDDLAIVSKLPPAAAFRKGIYFKTANEILQGQILQGVFSLAFPAYRYTTAMAQVGAALDGPPEVLLKRLAEARIAHSAFIAAFEPEFRKATRGLPQTVSFNFPISLQLFRQVFEEHYPNKNAVIQQIKECDPTLVLLLPKLALIKLLEGWDGGVPELVDETALTELQNRFMSLESDSQALLIAKLKGEDVEIPEDLEDIFHDLIQFGSEIHRREATVFNNLFERLFKEWNESIEGVG